jgi:hypothetical protein
VVEMKDMYRIVVSEFEGKRPFGRHILLGDNIKVYRNEKGCVGMD